LVEPWKASEESKDGGGSKKRNTSRSEAVHDWEEGELRGGWMRMAKVRNLASTPPAIYRI
jgi:hypothetical protein